MKRFLIVLLGLATLAACDGNPTNADATRYDLVRYFDNPLPFSANLDQLGAPCQDTLYAGFIELASGGSGVRMLHQRVRNCGGQRTLANEERAGTYSLSADTVHLTWHVGTDLISTFRETAILVENQLRIPYRVYTEAEPEGTVRYTVYQR